MRPARERLSPQAQPGSDPTPGVPPIEGALPPDRSGPPEAETTVDSGRISLDGPYAQEPLTLGQERTPSIPATGVTRQRIRPDDALLDARRRRRDAGQQVTSEAQPAQARS